MLPDYVKNDTINGIQKFAFTITVSHSSKKGKTHHLFPFLGGVRNPSAQSGLIDISYLPPRSKYETSK